VRTCRSRPSRSLVISSARYWCARWPKASPAAVIIETEAYVVGDAAGHAYRGMTPRNRSLFLEPGHAYVYFAYGSAYMLNVSSEPAGIGAGVLIRALEARDGVPIMQRNRRIERLRDLARGPGRLTAALRVDRRLDGLDLCREGPLWLGSSDHKTCEIGQSIRIGLAPGCQPAAAILSPGQSVRQRSKIAQAIRDRHSRPSLPS
jgi:DNA-3-methyladenine glycosylase